MIDEELDELYGSNEEVDIYLSYSRVADFVKNGPKALISRHDKGGEGMKVGSITDDWLYNRENFDKLYIVFDGVKPTATLGTLTDIIIQNYTEIPSKKEILNIIKKNEFWKRSKDDTKLANFDTPEFWKYLKLQFLATDKVIITSEQFELGKTLSEVLVTHKHSKELFSDKYERLDQFKFNITYQNVKFRGIIDMILLDHKNKTIRAVDLKTGVPRAEEFMSNFLKFKYYFQEAVYMLALDSILKELGLDEYQILSFQFLYIGRNEQVPIVFNITDKWHNAAITGFKTKSGYYFPGLEETVELIKWHFKCNEFVFSKDIRENNGNINLNDDFLLLSK